MRIALINENSQGAKNGMIYNSLKKVADQYGFEVTAAAKVKALTQWGCEWAIRREILREFAERGLEIASFSGGAAPGQAEVREREAAAAEPPTEA